MTHCKLIIATTGAMLLLGALVTGASATRIAHSNSTFRTSFREVTFGGAFGNFVCQITLEGSLHSRTVTKTAGSLVGYITAVNLGTCATGTATILRETLPWHMRYASFAGTLPNITGIIFNIIGWRFRIREPLLTCLATSTVENPVVYTRAREASGALTTARLSGSGIETTCGRVGSFNSDAGPVTVAGAATRITVTLI